MNRSESTRNVQAGPASAEQRDDSREHPLKNSLDHEGDHLSQRARPPQSDQGARYRTLRDLLPTLLLASLGIAISILAFLLLAMVESRAVEAEFREINRESLLDFQQALRLAEADLMTLAKFQRVNGHADERAFYQLTVELLQRNAAFRWLDWRPRVTADQRPEFEQARREEGHEDYRIQQFNDRFELISAEDRSEYFPIRFIAPHEEFASLVGFDLAPNPDRWSAPNPARVSGKPTITGPVRLPHDPAGPLGILLVVPIYEEEVLPQSVEQRLEGLTGYYVGVLQPTPLLLQSYAGFRQADISVFLFDELTEKLISHRPAEESPDGAFPFNDFDSVPSKVLHVVDEISWADRSWKLVAIASPQFTRSRATIWPWLILLGGILITFGSSILIETSSWQSRQLARMNEELSQANRQLFYSEQDHAITLQSLGDGVITADADFRITRLNPAAEELTGWTRNEALGKPIDEVFRVVDESTRQPASLPVAAILEPRTPSGVSQHSVLICRDNQERTISDNTAAIRDEQGNVVGVVVVFRDITEDRRIQRQIRQLNENLEVIVARRTSELEASAQRFRRTFEGAATGIAVLDPQGQFVEANAAYCQMLGYSEEGLLSRTFSSITHPDDIPQNLALFHELLAGIRDGFVLEKRYLDQNDSVVWCRVSVSAIRDHSQKARYMVIVAEDITQQRAAEEELRQSESLLQIASHVGKVGAWNLQLDRNEYQWSEEARRIHELEPKQEPEFEELLAYYLPQHQGEVREAFEACIRKGTPFDLELQMLTAKSRKQWVRLIGQAVRDRQGNIHRIQGAIQDIDERKKAENSLAASEARFRQLAEAMPIIVWTATPEGVVDYANQHFYQFTGLNTEVPLDPTWQKFLHPDDLEKCRVLWAESQAHRIPFSIKYRLRSAERGQFEWFHVQAWPIMDADGRLIKWYGAAAHVHEIIQLEQQATKLASHLTTTLESITDAFYTLDSDWRFDYVNAEAERLLKRSRAELSGKNVWEEFPQAIDTEFEWAYRRAIQEQEAVTFEAHYPPLDKWFEVHAYPSSEGLAVYFRDVTQRRESERLIRENEERFRLLAKASNDAIWDWDISTNLLWWNEGFETLFGFRRNEVEPTLDCWTTRIHPEDHARVLERLRHTMDSEAESFHCEYRFLHKEGHYRYVSDRGHIIRDSMGQPVRMIGGMTDLTERRHLESQLLQSQKMEAVGQLAGGIAHDFNNVLTIITGYSELLLTTLPADRPEQSMLMEIHEASERAANLTRQLLAFSRKQVLAPQVIDLNLIVAKMERLLGRLIPEDIQLVTRLTPLRHRILVDPGQLEQVIINLVVNARDAMTSGGILTLESRDMELGETESEGKLDCSPGSYVAFSVSDNGCGMSPEVREHIFEPFFTTKDPTRGTGLGLATVFGIVKQSGGAIDVESEPGQGTRFQILFPAVACEVSPLVLSESRVESGQETILLVEDDEGVRQLARLALENFGYRVVEAIHGREALDLLHTDSQSIQLIITDVVMPEMNGRELMEEIRKRDEHAKVLFMSGYTDDAIIRNGALEASEHFLQKPFTPTTLARKVREILGATS